MSSRIMGEDLNEAAGGSSDDEERQHLASDGLCEQCGIHPGERVQTDRREVVLLCSTCFGRHLRQQLPWRRYLSLTLGCFVVAPVLVLAFGTVSKIVETLRSAPSTGSSGAFTDLFMEGWTQVTTLSDPWTALGVVGAVAIALPLILVATTGDGASIAKRVRSSEIPNIDDHARLARLNSVLTAHVAITMFTATFVLILIADAVIDGEPGWAAITLCGLVVTAVLVVGLVRIDGFTGFADSTLLMIKAEIAQRVTGLRRRAKSYRLTHGAVVLTAALLLHVAGVVIVLFPSGPDVFRAALTVVLLSAVLIGALECFAYSYYRDGDITAASITVIAGTVGGIVWCLALLQVAYDKQFHVVNPLGVLVGCTWFIPMYVMIALGLLGRGMLRWLSYFSARLEVVSTALVRTRLGRRAKRTQV